MKKFLLLTLSSMIPVFFISAQQVTVSFHPKADTVSIDSVHVTNLTRGQTVKLAPGESVVFNIVTPAEQLLLNGRESPEGCSKWKSAGNTICSPEIMFE